MKMKKWMKSAVAILSIVAMLAENGASVYAAETGDILVEHTEVQEIVQEEPTAEETTAVEETAAAEEVAVDSSAPEETISEDVVIETGEETLVDAEPLESSYNEGTISFDNDQIRGAGFDSIRVNLNTDDLNYEESFKLSFEGPVDALYDPIINDVLDKTAGGYFDFENLGGSMFSIMPIVSDDVEVLYRYDQDNYPEIVLKSIEKEKEKILKSKELVSENGESIFGIYGEGLDSISLNFDSDNLNKKVSYTLYVDTEANASINGTKCGSMSGFDMNTTSANVDGLNGAAFTAYIVSDNDIELFTYSAVDSVENGEATISISRSAISKMMSASDDGITGQGFDEINLSMEYIKRLAGLSEDESAVSGEEDIYEYVLSINSDADVVVNGEALSDGKIKLDETVDEIVVEGLDETEFTISVNDAQDDTKYAKTEENETDVKYSVLSSEDGTAKIAVTYSTAQTKTVYEYEDSKVYVKATLELADAVPDVAEFVVTEVLPESNGYNYDAYIEALNNNIEAVAGENAEDREFTEENTLLYDVAFYVTDEDGNRIEYEPKEGSVRIEISFKQNQLEEDLAAEVSEDISIIHLPLTESVKNAVDTTEAATDISASDIKFELVSETTSIDGEGTEFSLNDLSVVAITSLTNEKYSAGPDISVASIMGESRYYGVIANSFNNDNHMHSNLATKVYSGSNDFTVGNFNNDKNPGKTIIASITSDAWVKINGSKADVYFGDTVDKTHLIDQTMSNAVQFLPVEYLNGEVTRLFNTPVDNMAKAVSDAEKMSDKTLLSVKSNVQGAYDGEATLDLTKSEDGKTYFFRVDDGTLQNKIKINKLPGQTVVFYYPQSGYVNIKQSCINGKWTGSGGAEYADTAAHVFYYAPNATNLYIDSIAGVVIAPKADVDFMNSNGWLVCDKVSHHSAEWHFVGQDVPPPEFNKLEYEVPIKKIINDNGTDRVPTEDEKFTFEAYVYHFDGAYYDETPAITAENEGELAKLKFNFDEEGTYAYKIVEKNVDNNGLEYATNSYVVHFKVEKSLSGLLSFKEINFYVESGKKWVGGADYVPTFINKKADCEIEVRKKVFINGSQVSSSSAEADRLFYFRVRPVIGTNADGSGGTLGDAIKNPSPITGLPDDVFSVTQNNPTVISHLPIYKWYQIEEVCGGNYTSLVETGKEIGPTTNVSESSKFAYTVKYEGECYELLKQENNEYVRVYPRFPERGSAKVNIYNYRNRETDITIAGNKTVNTKAVSSSDKKTYTFIMSGKSDNCKGKTYTAKTVPGNGAFAFEKITYKEPGTYEYEVTEQNAGKTIDGMTYAAYKYSVVVSVAEKQDGSLEATKVIKDGSGKTVDAITFNNTYAATGKIKLYAKKVLNNRAITANDNFKFILTGYKNANQTKSTTNENGTVSDTVAFDEITYDLNDVGKEITYTISEKPGSVAGVTYSTDVYTVTVNVVDNGDGTLTATANKATVGSPVVFTNEYTESGKVGFKVTKKYADGCNMPEGKSFGFILSKVENGVATEIERKTITGEGSKYFTEIEYADLSKVGTYTYTIREDLDTPGATAANNYTVDGVVYDPTVHEIVVEVTSGGAGSLNIATTLDGVLVADDAEVNAVFTNDYDVKSCAACIEGLKTLVGKNLEAGDFTFKFEPVQDYGDALEVGESGTCATCGQTIEQIKQTTDGKTYYLSDNVATGEFGLHDMKFKAAGTYTFRVTEVNGGDSNIDYDDSVYTFTFDIVDVNGQLMPRNTDKEVTISKVTTSGSVEVSAIEFTNTYNAQGTVTLYAQKELTSKVRSLAAGDFNFELLDSTKTNRIGDIKSNNDSGLVTFDTITYTLSQLGSDTEKSFEYYIHEIAPTPKVKGYTYDESYHKVTVNVKLNKATGELEATPAYENNASKAFIENEYEATGKDSFGGNKIMSGRRLKGGDNGDKFYADLYDENGSLIDSVLIKKNLLDLTGKTGSFTFKELTFDEPGNYTYTVKESTGEYAVPDGVTMDDTIYKVVVSVEDDEKKPGELSVSHTFYIGENEVDELSFTNTYDAEGSTHFTASKSLTGATITDGQFDFNLYEAVEGANGTYTLGGKIDGKSNNGTTVTFKNIEYKEKDIADSEDGSKEFTYFITEEDKKVNGFTYDSSVYAVKVTVSENGAELSVSTPEYYKTTVDGDVITIGAKTDAGAAFENSYEADGAVTLSLNKTLTGRDMSEDQFTFVLKNEGGTVIDEIGSAAAKNGVAATSEFKELTFDESDLSEAKSHKLSNDGTYAKYYTIRETSESGNGYTCDTAVYSVVVTLKDNGKGHIDTEWYAWKNGSTPEDNSGFWSGLLSKLTGNTVGHDVSFANSYEAKGHIQFNATKVVEGMELTSDYLFTLTGTDGTNEEVYNDLDKVTFTEIEYDSVGEYTYTISETPGSKPGVTYAGNTYTIKVTVTDPGTGVLSVVADTTYTTDEDGKCIVAPVEFINSYRTDDTSVTIGGTKTLTGRELVDDEFTFTMVNAPGNTKTYSETTTNKSGGFTFPSITYTFEDMYNAETQKYDAEKDFAYIVTEIDDGADGVTYDTTPRNVVVRVTNAEGKLTAKVYVDDVLKNTTSTALSFDNTYDTSDSLTLKAKKISNAPAKDKVFTFDLSGDETDSKTAVNGGTATFKTITYKLSDLTKKADGTYERTYNYVVSENPGSYKGYSFSQELYEVTVVVTSDGKGSIDKDVTYKRVKDVDGNTVDEAVDEITFTNAYTAQGSLEIEGTKELVGKELSEGDFTFRLIDADGDVVSEQSNSAPDAQKLGHFTLAAHYNEENIGKTYTYMVVESDENPMQNVIYSKVVYNVSVTVNDNGDGTLDPVATITAPNGTKVEKVAFKNEFVDDATVTFEATKTLENHPLADGQFTFQLLDSKGDVLVIDKKEQTKPNIGTGVTFDTIKYSLDDKDKDFTYTIREVEGTDEYITYSKEVYTAVVRVRLVDGKLVATPTITNKAGKEVGLKGINFVNTYESSTSVELAGEKTVTGFGKRREGKSTDYYFGLYDQNGELVDIRSTKGGGKFEFKQIDELTYDQTRMSEDPTYYYYTVKELVPGDEDYPIEGATPQENVTYDPTVYEVTVKLYYDSDDKIEALVTTNKNTKDTLDFENIYQAEDEVVLEAFKTITGKNIVKDAYTFTLTGEGQNQEKTNSTVANKVTFDKITYTQDDIGDHTYTIKETKSTDGSTVDTQEYKVVVTVADGEDGTFSVTKQYYKGSVSEANKIEPEDVVFENTYSATGDITIGGKKILVDKELDAKAFTFEIKAYDGKQLTSKNTKTVLTAENAAGALDDKTKQAEGAFTFPVLEYSQEDLLDENGTYAKKATRRYVVSETQNAVPGINKTCERYYVDVTIEDKGDGTLDVSKVVIPLNEEKDKSIRGLLENFFGNKKEKEIVFINKYEAQGFWDPVGYKTLVGRDIQDGEFVFQIEDKATGETETVNNVGNEIRFDHTKVSFLRYDQNDIGDHEYVITELDGPDNDGIEYSPVEFTIKVRVSDPKNNGQLVADVIETSPDYSIDDETIEKAEFHFAFVNKYKAEGAIDFKGYKTIDGLDIENAPKFDFFIEDLATGETKKVSNVNGEVVFSSTEIPFLNYVQGEKDGKAYNDIGIHEYKIYENPYGEVGDVKKPDENGIVGDRSYYIVKVQVKALDQDGNVVDKVDKNTKLSNKLDTSIISVTKFDPQSENPTVGDKVATYFNTTDADGKYTAMWDKVFTFKNEFIATASMRFKGIKKVVDDETGEVVDADLSNYRFAIYQFEDAARTIGGKLVGNPVKCGKDGSFLLPDTAIGFNQEMLKNLQTGKYDLSKELYYRIVEVKDGEGAWNEDKTVFEVDGVKFDNTVYDIDVLVENDGTKTLKLTTNAVMRKSETAKDSEEYKSDSYNFTNRKTTEYVEIPVSKVWVDGDKTAKDRDYPVTFNLYADGKIVATYTSPKNPDNFTYVFKTDDKGRKLPKYDGSKIISYTVGEAAYPGYSTDIAKGKEENSWVVTNTSGKIRIRKIDARTKLTLPGATLAIMDGSKEVERFTTTDAAYVVKATLEPGKEYVLKEISAPEGYRIAESKTFTVPKDGSDIGVTMEDDPIVGAVTLTKRDADTRETLAGAEFALYTTGDVRVYASGTTGSYTYSTSTSNGVFVTDGAGNLTISGLPFGSYYFREVEAPSGYELSSERPEFTISATSLATPETISFVNTKSTGRARLLKTSSIDGSALAGATFELYSKTPRTAGQAVAGTLFSSAYYLYGTYTTDSTGSLYIPDLPWDDYYFIETEAPEGYVLNTDVNGDSIVYPFTVDGTAAIRTAIDLGSITNTPGGGTGGGVAGVVPGGGAGGGVAGVRKLPGGVLSGVLGVRAKPTSGVLGVRVGPTTGDAANIALWLVLLLASISVVIAICIQSGKKRKSVKKQ